MNHANQFDGDMYMLLFLCLKYSFDVLEGITISNPKVKSCNVNFCMNTENLW